MYTYNTYICTRMHPRARARTHTHTSMRTHTHTCARVSLDQHKILGHQHLSSRKPATYKIILSSLEMTLAINFICPRQGEIENSVLWVTQPWKPVLYRRLLWGMNKKEVSHLKQLPGGYYICMCLCLLRHCKKIKNLWIWNCVEC